LQQDCRKIAKGDDNLRPSPEENIYAEDPAAEITTITLNAPAKLIAGRLGRTDR
jgi:hypothetical protein